jgi:hypothetical protein
VVERARRSRRCALSRRRARVGFETTSTLGMRDQPDNAAELSIAHREKNSTLGAPSLARIGAGPAGDDSETVRQTTPGNSVPGRFSTTGMVNSPVGVPLKRATEKGYDVESISATGVQACPA